MSLTLSDGTTTVTLDPDLLWSDEFSWKRVEQSVVPSVTGALIVQSARFAAGRPITLQPEDNSAAWMPRSALEQLYAWSEQSNLVLVLDGLRGLSRSVVFRSQNGAPIEAGPVLHRDDVEPDDAYLVTLKLMEI